MKTELAEVVVCFNDSFTNTVTLTPAEALAYAKRAPVDPEGKVVLASVIRGVTDIRMVDMPDDEYKMRYESLGLSPDSFPATFAEAGLVEKKAPNRGKLEV